GDGLREQVAPGVVPVAVAPVLGLAVDGGGRAVDARVLRGGQPVQLIVGETLVARVLAVVEDSPDIAVVPVAQVEVIGDVKHISLIGGNRVRAVRWQAGGAGSHTTGLKALVIAEGVADAGKAGRLAAKETGEGGVRRLTHPLLRSANPALLRKGWGTR